MKEPKIDNLKLNKKATQKMRDTMKKATKVKITINFDSDLLEEVREMADHIGSPYQTLLNNLLREALKNKESQEDRLNRLEKEIRALKKKIAS